MRDGNEIRVAVIGYGLAGAVFHAPLIAATPGMRVAAVVTSNPDRAAQARRDHVGVEVLDSADRVWERAGEFDLAVVASPNRTHVPLAGAAIQAGIPVVVDKPLAASSGDARRLVDEARRRGVMLTVFQNRRWDGDFLTLQRLIAEGVLGDAFRFESRFERWRPAPKGGWRERGDPAEGGGVLFDLGSHLVDQALVLFGPAAEVYAEVDSRRDGVEVDDDAFVAITHASGARSHLWMGLLAADMGPRLRVLGTRGAYVKTGMDVQEEQLRGDGPRPPEPSFGVDPRERWGRVGAGEEWREIETERGSWPAFYAAVAEALRAGAPPPVDPADAVAVLEIIEAARRSSAEKRVVPVRAN
jgi:predicted dehydrogenase